VDVRGVFVFEIVAVDSEERWSDAKAFFLVQVALEEMNSD
jgi:hypothetical protein